ncbi:hypothetical protein CEXT_645571 [Caerostris extrusa]|uniref:Uncharacterized protein n=1 Tax=Caerostris extrusa TaxID=172846 RepID=A0AAV4MHU6_CAEEX|nr:hypothetical protein CEXT_645571 [Caerostris extrusa]
MLKVLKIGKTGSSFSRGTAPFPGANEECRRGSLCARGWPLSGALCLWSVIANILGKRINHDEMQITSSPEFSSLTSSAKRIPSLQKVYDNPFLEVANKTRTAR